MCVCFHTWDSSLNLWILFQGTMVLLGKSRWMFFDEQYSDIFFVNMGGFCLFGMLAILSVSPGCVLINTKVHTSIYCRRCRTVETDKVRILNYWLGHLHGTPSCYFATSESWSLSYGCFLLSNKNFDVTLLMAFPICMVPLVFFLFLEI